MSQEHRHGATGAASHHDAAGVDRIELHHGQQLSALVDGELAPDQARFLLRRLEHDQELAGRYERWQLCGQVMRREVSLAAGAGFSERVAQAIREEGARTAAVAQAASAGRRAGWARWGGGAAALAASVAAVALLVNRPQPLAEGYPAAAPAVLAERAAPVPAAVAGQAVTPASVQADGPGPALAGIDAPAAKAATPDVRRPAPASVRPAAVDRARAVVATAAAPAASRAVPEAPAATAAAGPELVLVSVAGGDSLPAAPVVTDPFASASPLHARPWPRAVLPQASGGYTASFGQDSQTSAFYPFEPRLPAAEDEAPQAPAAEPDEAPH